MDKENEELSFYHKINPQLTTCGTCAKCINYTPSHLELSKERGLIVDRFEECSGCSICEDCKNGIGLSSPPGLKGHTIVSGDAGIIIYGGTKWTKTNHTTQDNTNKGINLFTDICRDALAKLNLEKDLELGDQWKPLTAYDIATRRWWNVWLETLPASKIINVESVEERDKVLERLKCFNMTAFPPFEPIQRDVIYSSNVYFLPTDRCEEDCNGNGQCSLSRCTCKNGWHGDSCNKKNCPNSLCYIDIDTLEI